MTKKWYTLPDINITQIDLQKAINSKVDDVAVSPVLALLGDSITSQHWSNDTRFLNRFTQLAFWAIGNEIAYSPISDIINYGVAGETSSQILTRVVALRSDVGVCAVLAGTNDMLSVSTSDAIDTSLELFKNNIKEITNSLKTANIIPILTTIPPCNNATTFGTTFGLLANAWLFEYVQTENVYLLDTFNVLVDHSSNTANGKTDCLSDGIHLSNKGADLIAPFCANILDDIFRFYNNPLTSSTIDSRANDHRNNKISINPSFNFTTGGVKNGLNVSGNVADGWCVYDNTSNASIACSVLPQVKAPLWLSSQGADAGLWETGLIYTKDECVVDSGIAYVCLNAHASSVFATELGNGYWREAPTFGNCQQLKITDPQSAKAIKLYQVASFESEFETGKYVRVEGMVEVINPVNVDACELTLITEGDIAVNGYTYRYAGAGGTPQGVVKVAIPDQKRFLKTPLVHLSSDYGNWVQGNIHFTMTCKDGGGSAVIRLSNTFATIQS